MHLAPQKISYSDDASSTKESASVADKEKNESQLDQSDVISPIEEVHKEENPAISHNSTLDHLEDALSKYNVHIMSIHTCTHNYIVYTCIMFMYKCVQCMYI